MKVRIYETTLDPMYKICLDNFILIEQDIVSEEFFKKYQRVMKEFEEIQDTIKQLGRSQGYW